MKEDWTVKFLEDIAEIGDGNHSGNYPKASEMVSEGVPFIRGTNLVDGKVDSEDLRFISAEKHEILKKGHLKTGDILFTNRGQVGKKAIVDDRFSGSNLNSQVAWFRCSEQINNRYLFYFLDSPSILKYINVNTNGTALQQLTIRQIRKLKIVFPPLSEQKQIVAILDKAFTAIDQAKTNIKKNIENAKELFQSKLNEIFSKKGEGWEEKRFSELFKLKSGDGLTAKNMIEGPFPVYGGNGIAGHHNNYNKDGEYLIIGRVGALCGNVRYLNEKFWLTDNAFQISEMKVEFDYNFLCYLLNSKELRSYARQAAQPVISNSSLKDVLISYPTSISIQKKYASTFLLLEAKIEEIISTYETKTLELEDLKKSILQKAFAGELTSTGSVTNQKEVAI